MTQTQEIITSTDSVAFDLFIVIICIVFVMIIIMLIVWIMKRFGFNSAMNKMSAVDLRHDKLLTSVNKYQKQNYELLKENKIILAEVNKRLEALEEQQGRVRKDFRSLRESFSLLLMRVSK